VLNPDDVIHIPIKGKVLIEVIDVPRELALPPLSLPQPSSEPSCNAWFPLKNVFGEEVKCTFRFQVEEDVDKLLGISILLRETNVEISELVLAPEEHKDIRIAISSIPGARLVDGDLTNVLFGYVFISAQGFEVSIKLQGTLLAGRTFALSTSTLIFYTKRLSESFPNRLVLSRKSQKEGFWVRNLSSRTSLTIRLKSGTLDLGEDYFKYEYSNEKGESSLLVPSADQQEYDVEPEKSVHIPLQLLAEEAAKRLGALLLDSADGGDGTASSKGPKKGKAPVPMLSTVVQVFDIMSPNSIETITVALQPDECSSGDEDEVDVPFQKQLSIGSDSHEVTDLDTPSSMASSGAPLLARGVSLGFPARSRGDSHHNTNATDVSGVLSFPDVLGDKESFGGDVSVTESTISSVHTSATAFDGIQGSVVLRGCTPMSGSLCRYVADVGQHELSSGRKKWLLNIENKSRSPVEYELFLVNPKDRAWVDISRSNGFLAAEHEYHKIHLGFSTESFGSFSTYLVLIENKNLAIKFVRLSLDVVVNVAQDVELFNQANESMYKDPGPIRMFTVFSCGVGATEPGSSIEVQVGTGASGFAMDNYSFVIKNNSVVPLAFDLAHNSQDPSTIRFLLGISQTISVSRLTVPAGSQLQVYMVVNPVSQLSSKEGIQVAISCDTIKGHNIFLRLHGQCVDPGFRLGLKVQSQGVFDYPYAAGQGADALSPGSAPSPGPAQFFNGTSPPSLQTTTYVNEQDSVLTDSLENEWPKQSRTDQNETQLSHQVVDLYFSWIDTTKRYDVSIENLDQGETVQFTSVLTSPVYFDMEGNGEISLAPGETSVVQIFLNQDRIARSEHRTTAQYVMGHAFIIRKVGETSLVRMHFVLHYNSGGTGAALSRGLISASDRSHLEEQITQVLRRLVTRQHSRQELEGIRFGLALLTDILIYLASKSSSAKLASSLAILLFGMALGERVSLPKEEADHWCQELSRYVSAVTHPGPLMETLHSHLNVARVQPED